jgi:hypothetical protein
MNFNLSNPQAPGLGLLRIQGRQSNPLLPQRSQQLRRSPTSNQLHQLTHHHLAKASISHFPVVIVAKPKVVIIIAG